MPEKSLESPPVKSTFPAYASSFFAGAMVLFIELAGARWLAPSFGSALDVWASLLSVTLLAISLGAWVGGSLGDRSPRYRTLAWVWWASSLALAVCLLLRRPVLGWSGNLGPGSGALLSSLVLYFPALFLLSAAAPLAVRLAAPSPDQVGRVVGRFSAVGTAGSCLGALVTGFILVPHFSLTRLFAGAAFISAGFGLTLLSAAWKRPAPLLGLLGWGALLFLLSTSRSSGNLAGGNGVLLVMDTVQSLYGQIRIVETPQSRYLLLDGIIQGGQDLGDQASVAGYTSTMEALGRSAVAHPKRVLVIGLGAAILPNRFAALGAAVDTVEINGQMVEEAKKWFGFNPAPGRLHRMDGRRFLAQAQGPYDLILIDAFSGEEVPGHLMTEECFRRCRDLLAPQGALLMNYVGFDSGPDSLVPSVIAGTLQRDFAQVELYALGEPHKRDNLILVARSTPTAWGPVPRGIPGPPDITAKFSALSSYKQSLPSSDQVFRDDWHPADWMDRHSRSGWRKEALEFMNRYGIDG